MRLHRPGVRPDRSVVMAEEGLELAAMAAACVQRRPVDPASVPHQPAVRARVDVLAEPVVEQLTLEARPRQRLRRIAADLAPEEKPNRQDRTCVDLDEPTAQSAGRQRRSPRPRGRPGSSPAAPVPAGGARSAPPDPAYLDPESSVSTERTREGGDSAGIDVSWRAQRALRAAITIALDPPSPTSRGMLVRRGCAVRPGWNLFTVAARRAPRGPARSPSGGTPRRSPRPRSSASRMRSCGPP